MRTPTAPPCVGSYRATIPVREQPGAAHRVRRSAHRWDVRRPVASSWTALSRMRSAAFTCCPSFIRSTAPTRASIRPTTRRSIARLGTWADVQALAARTAVMADLIVNHVSRRAAQFQDYDRHGDASRYAGMFLTFGQVFPGGASESALLALYTIRPTLPFTRHDTAAGASVVLWTTFTSDQIDIDVTHPEATALPVGRTRPISGGRHHDDPARRRRATR